MERHLWRGRIMVLLRETEPDLPAAPAAADEHLADCVVHQKDSAAALLAAQAAFEQLYRRHASRLLGFLASRVQRSDLDEVHQDVWLRVWERLPRSFHGGDFSAWLYQTTRHYLIDRSRKKRPLPLGDDADFADDRPAPDEVLVEQERRAALVHCLGRLEVRAAELVRSRLAGDSYEEICPRLGLKPESAHKMFYRAKAILREAVAQVLRNH
jgi:RNA polymerase sigma-70 factor, ECF subfamily